MRKGKEKNQQMNQQMSEERKEINFKGVFDIIVGFELKGIEFEHVQVLCYESDKREWF